MKKSASQMESVKESMSVGAKLEDIGKSLPQMVIGGGAGVTLAKALNVSWTTIGALGFLMAGIGYLVNVWLMKKEREKTGMLYVRNVYDRALYFGGILTGAPLCCMNCFPI